MANETIRTYEGNTHIVTCSVEGISSLAGYTSTLSVKEYEDDTDVLFTVTGTITDLNIVYVIQADDNDMLRGSRHYECTITDGAYTFTIAKGEYELLRSLVFVED